MKIKPRIAAALGCALLAGVLVGWGLPDSDACHDFASVSKDAMTINTEILNSTTAFLKADTANDASGMIDASNRLTKATSDLDALKTRYDAADRKCNV